MGIGIVKAQSVTIPHGVSVSSFKAATRRAAMPGSHLSAIGGCMLGCLIQQLSRPERACQSTVA
jgi:hypothetical protein